MGLPIIGSSSPDVEAEQDSAIDIGGNQNVRKDCTSWPTPGGDSQVFSSQTDQSGEPLPRYRSGYSVAAGLESQVPGGIGALPKSAEAFRM